MNQKTNKYTSGKLEEGKPQKIGDSINNYSAGARRCSIKKMFYERLVKITGKYLFWILFLYKVSDLLLNRYFHVNFAKSLRKPILVNTSGGYFFQMLPNLKRTEHTQLKDESKAKQNNHSKLF